VGLATLARGGNAVDAAVAAALALSVVTPYCCGPGGDAFAIVWDGALHGYLGSGRSPADATLEAVKARVGNDMPWVGAHTVTVPGAVAGWFDLLERWGTRPFGELARDARRLAREGFRVAAHGAGQFIGARGLYRDFPDWLELYGHVEMGTRLVQPALARAFELLAEDGPDAFYRGPIAGDIAAAVERAGGLMTTDDLVGYAGEWAAPMRAPFAGIEVAELPPPTQGVTALEVLRITDGLDLTDDPGERAHLLIEATKLALADRDEHITDPAAMRIAPDALLLEDYVIARRREIDPRRAAQPVPGRPQRGGTAYLCAADGDGLLVSLIQSNFLAFGSGIYVPEWGINLNNRGSSFTLDAGHVNLLAPAKRPMHTLIPAMGLRDGEPCLVFGTMGGDAQVPTQLQVITSFLRDGADLQDAISAPRWRVDPATWHVHVEDRAPGLREALEARGHRVGNAAAYDNTMGHAHAIAVAPSGYDGATDPRAEGAVIGC